MIEVTGDGLRLPRISSGGWMPWIANSRRFDPAGPPARVGLLMINVGANEPLMRRAIEELPGEVSLAFLPGTPDLPRWLARARERGHESYLMLPAEDPGGIAERGTQADRDLGRHGRESAPPAPRDVARRRLCRLRRPLAGSRSAVGSRRMRPLIREIADRGLALVEINPTPDTAILHRLTVEFGVGYARSTNILDYRLASDGVAGSLDRLVAWIGESGPTARRGTPSA